MKADNEVYEVWEMNVSVSNNFVLCSPSLMLVSGFEVKKYCSLCEKVYEMVLTKCKSGSQATWKNFIYWNFFDYYCHLDEDGYGKNGFQVIEMLDFFDTTLFRVFSPIKFLINLINLKTP